MAPLDPTAHGRYLVHYSTGFRPHTVKWYYEGDRDDAAFQDFWNTLIGDVGPLLSASTLLGIDHAPATSHITAPIATTGFTDSWGSGVADGRVDSRYVSFVGRSGGGIRWKAEFFGLNVAVTDNNFRFAAGENGAVDAAVATLIAAVGFPTAIDGTLVLVKNYANHGYNAYWQRKTR